MNFDWHMLYPLHTVILDNSRDFRGVPCRAQLCNFSKWFFSPCFGVIPIWELWQFWYVRKGPPKNFARTSREFVPYFCLIVVPNTWGVYKCVVQIFCCVVDANGADCV